MTRQRRAQKQCSDTGDLFEQVISRGPVPVPTLTAFRYNGDLYIRVVPVKSLFRSNMVYEVTTRGDVFAVRLRDQALTVIPGTATVGHTTIEYRSV